MTWRGWCFVSGWQTAKSARTTALAHFRASILQRPLVEGRRHRSRASGLLPFWAFLQMRLSYPGQRRSAPVMEIIWQQTSTAESQRINLGSPKFKNYSVLQLLKPRALIQCPNKRIYMFSMLLYAREVVLGYSAERAHTAGDVKQEDRLFHFSSACRLSDCYSTHAHLHAPSLPKDVETLRLDTAYIVHTSWQHAS